MFIYGMFCNRYDRLYSLHESNTCNDICLAKDLGTKSEAEGFRMNIAMDFQQEISLSKKM